MPLRLVGTRSRATGVARLEAVAALFACSRPMDARRRTRGSASLPALAEKARQSNEIIAGRNSYLSMSAFGLVL